MDLDSILPPPSTPVLKREVRISAGGDNRGKVHNQTVTWGALMKRLSHVTVTAEKFIDYQRASPDVRNDLKNAPGYWIGAHCADGKRKKSGITERDIMCFDIDNGSLFEGDLVKMLRDKTTAISEYEFFVHSSRSHTSINPRLRLVFLLKEPVSASKYEAFSRILAHKLDPNMRTVDPVSFRLAQMMYLPSCSVDMQDQFIAFRNEGALVDPETILESWSGDWSDPTALPRCPGEEDLRVSAAKAENPMEKRGVIGTFCRTYDIYSAIEKFLPDTFYETDYEGSEVRYKYANSEGGAGAVVYEDGLFLYSHHGTDPYSDRLLNAWDLVRLHKFGDLDDSARADTPITSMPSYKAMVELASHDPKVKSSRALERFDFSDLDVDTYQNDIESDIKSDSDSEPDIMADLLGEAPKTAPVGGLFGAMDDAAVESLIGAQPKARSDDWVKKLDMTEKNGIKPTSYNLEIILSNDTRLAGAFGYNRLTQGYVQLRDLVSPGLEPLPLPKDQVRDVVLSDRHVTWVRMLLDSPTPLDGGKGFDLRMAFGEVDAIIKLVADQYAFHPVIDWIESVPWDGTPRIDTFLHRHLKAEDTPYTREVSRLLFLGASARVLEPGHKFDTAIILEGIQGAGKSTFISALANHRWFGELDTDLSDRRKTVEQLSGMWFVEIPELSAFSKREVEEIKAFISTQRSQVRAAFARNAEMFERQCIMMGSTNKDTYLSDATGNRRFLPVRVPPGTEIDNLAVWSEAQQAHAEAMHIIKEMRRRTPRSVMENLPLMLSKDIREDAAEEVAMRVMDDFEQLMSDRIERWANMPVPVSTIVNELGLDESWLVDGDPMAVRNWIQLDTIWISALGRSAKDFDNKASFTISRIMGTAPQWRRAGRKIINGSRARGYFRVCDGACAEDFDTNECAFTIVGDDAMGGLI